MKAPRIVLFVFLALTVCVFADPSHDVLVRADKLEKKVTAALAAGKITKDVADKYTERLQNIHNAMRGQGSTTTERRGMREDMDRISSALTSGSTVTFGDTPQ